MRLTKFRFIDDIYWDRDDEELRHKIENQQEIEIIEDMYALKWFESVQPDRDTRLKV